MATNTETGLTRQKVLLNVDMGEAYGNYTCGPDLEILPMIDIANVACGFHAGDPIVIRDTVRNCKSHNVLCGAHPGLPDLQGFGRREMKLLPEELTAITVYQVGALKGFLDRENMPLNHVKPHGALYGMMCRDYEVAKAVLKAIPKGVPVIGLPNSEIQHAAKDMAVPFMAELYGDVKYTDQGQLILDRKKKPWKMEDVRSHVTQQIYKESATSLDGNLVPLPWKGRPATVCCHSDSPGCLDIIKTAKSVIDKFKEQT